MTIENVFYSRSTRCQRPSSLREQPYHVLKLYRHTGERQEILSGDPASAQRIRGPAHRQPHPQSQPIVQCQCRHDSSRDLENNAVDLSICCGACSIWRYTYESLQRDHPRSTSFLLVISGVAAIIAIFIFCFMGTIWLFGSW